MMKKILKLLLFILPFVAMMNTALAKEQAYIYLGDEIPNVRLHLKTPYVEKNKKMYQIFNRNTGGFVYCIEPGAVLKDGYATAYQDVNDVELLYDLTSEDWNYLRLIAYLGYGYQNRTDIKWYAVTQFMIWDYILEGIGEIYFIDEDNQPIDLYSKEIAELQYDVDRFYQLPSFFQGGNTLEIKAEIGEEIVLKDTYGMLDEMTITLDNGEFEVIGDELHITLNRPGNQVLRMFKYTHLEEIAKIFYSPSSQAVMNRGIINLPYGGIHFDVLYPKFNLVKKSSEDYGLSLAGAVYGVYFENGSLWEKIVTDENGYATVNRMPLGKYYIQELEAPYGHYLNEEKIYFEIIDQDVTLEVSDVLIKKKIIIEKYLKNIDGELELEKNARFQVVNANTNELVTTFETNQYGKYQLELPYGEYILKQVSSTLGYSFCEDIYLTIDEDTEEDTTIVLEDEQIRGSLLVLKKDMDTQELILDEALFKIFNVDTNEYLTIDGKDTFATSQGKLYLENIPYGSYQLVEVKAPDGYVTSSQKYSFVIKDEEQINIEVFNQLQNGSLIIEKVDDESLQPIEGVLFGLYDEFYKLIDQYYTDQDGKISIDHLLEGLYYIKELEAPDGYQVLDGFMDVEIKNNVLSTIKVTNRLKINVPKTGTNEFILTILFSAACLLVGAFICNEHH